MQILNPDLVFEILKNLGQKNQSCLYYLEVGTYVISRFLILVPILVFWISKPKSIFGKIRIEKLKVVQFGWKLAHRASRWCWFLFQHYVFQFPTLILFLDKFGPKKLNSPLCLKGGTQSILGCDCKNTRPGLKKIKMNNWIKRLLLLYLYRS